MIDLTNQVFGKLTVLEKTNKRLGSSIVWKCKCSCGKITYASSNNLRKENTKSCGCLQLSTATKHDMIKTVEYKAWCAIIQRCNNPNEISYINYGGRGIKVCSRWLNSFENFYQDMGDRPSNKHSLDRKDNNKGYSPDNCKWSTKKEQQSNLRSNVFIDYKGEKLTQAEVARRENIPYKTLAYKVTKGLFKRWLK